jgi:hypothetical protein
MQGIHFDGDPFTGGAPLFFAKKIGSNEASVFVKPSAQENLRAELARIPGKIGKNDLGNILGQPLISIHPPQRGIINKTQIIADDLFEGFFIPCRGECFQQCPALIHGFNI